MEKYQNKYRISSHRMPNWDYSTNGIYFLTIVTQNRVCNLGKIDNNNMILSDFGKIIENELLKSFQIRDELFLDEYIIMPNHIHTIVILYQPKINGNNLNGSHDSHNSHGSHGSHVETHGRASLQSREQPREQFTNMQFIRKPKSISSFFAGFKSAVNSKIDDYIDIHKLNMPKYNKNNHFFQPNYHDHIIRNDNEYNRIRNYLLDNPKNWEDDKFYKNK